MTYVVQLARTRYAGTNHTHLTELLMEREGIDLSRSTVRRILAVSGTGHRAAVELMNRIQRRALKPASSLMARASLPRLPNFSRVRRTLSKS